MRVTILNPAADDADAVASRLGLIGLDGPKGASPIDATRLAGPAQVGADDVPAAIARSLAAFAVWRRTPAPVRINALQQQLSPMIF
jgi:acyl-CoA reductase-like NAD-dependent aldehyde dehydrogenase